MSDASLHRSVGRAGSLRPVDGVLSPARPRREIVRLGAPEYVPPPLVHGVPVTCWFGTFLLLRVGLCLLGLLRQDGVTNLAARLRHHAWQPAHVVLRLLGISLSGSSLFGQETPAFIHGKEWPSPFRYCSLVREWRTIARSNRERRSVNLATGGGPCNANR
jgi:hypothetical protein